MNLSTIFRFRSFYQATRGIRNFVILTWSKFLIYYFDTHHYIKEIHTVWCTITQNNKKYVHDVMHLFYYYFTEIAYELSDNWKWPAETLNNICIYYKRKRIMAKYYLVTFNVQCFILSLILHNVLPSSARIFSSEKSFRHKRQSGFDDA